LDPSEHPLPMRIGVAPSVPEKSRVFPAFGPLEKRHDKV
jgi:hypothetical protein